MRERSRARGRDRESAERAEPVPVAVPEMIRTFFNSVGRGLRLLWTVLSAVVVLIYLIIARSFLFLTAAIVCLYFASGSDALRRGVELAVTEAIPGELNVGGLQWGPQPGSVSLVGIEIKDPAGEQVVLAPAIDVDIDLIATGAGLVRWMTVDDAPFVFGVRRLVVRQPILRLITGEDGKLTLAAALSSPRAPKEPKTQGGSVDLSIRDLSVRGAEVFVEVPGTKMEIKGLDLKSKFDVRPNGSTHIDMPMAQIDSLDVQLPETVAVNEDGSPFVLQAKDSRLKRVIWRDGHLEYTLRTQDLSGGTLDARGELDLGPTGQGWAADVTLDLPLDSPILPTLSRRRAMGPVSLRVNGGGSFDEIYVQVHVESPNLSVSGVSLSNLDLDVAVEPHISGDGLLTHRVHIPQLNMATLGGTLRVEDARFDPIATRPQSSGPPTEIDTSFQARVIIDGMNPYAIAAVPKVGSMLAVLPGPDGVVHMDATLSGGRRRFDGTWFAALHLPKFQLGWQGLPGVPLADEISLQGGASVSQRTHPDGGIALDLEIENLDLRSGTDHLVIDGTASLPRGALDLKLDVSSQRLGATLGEVGVRDVAGRLKLESFHITGTVESPDATGWVRMREARFGKLALGRLDGRVRMASGVLGLERVSLAAPWGRAKLAGEVTLWRTGWNDLSPTMPFSIDRLEAKEVALHKLIRGSGITTEISMDLTKLTGKISDPIRSLRGRGRLRTSSLTGGGEKARKIEATLRGDSQEIALDDIVITLDGGQTIEASASLNKRSGTVKARVATESLPFSALGAVTRGVVPLKGSLSTEIHVEGTLEEPMVIGTLGLESFAYGGVVLGDGVLNFTTGEGGVIDISASENFEGTQILDGSILRLNRGSLEQILFKLQADKADVFSILPGVRIPEASLRLTGLVDVDIRPGDPEQVYELRVDAEPGGMKLGLYDGEVQLENLSPLFLVHDTKALTIEQTTWGRGTKESLSMCGRLESGGDLDFQLAGELDLELLHGLRGSFSSLTGSFSISDDPTTGHALGGDRCLSVKGDRLLRVHGSTSDLKLSGRLRARRVALTPRGFGREILLTDGSSIELRPGRGPGELRVILPEHQPYRFRGQLDSGGLELVGEVLLKDMKPQSIDLGLLGTDLFFSSPGEFNLTFNPDLTLSARDFSDEERRSLKLGGAVLITEGLYYKNFDQLAQALGSMGGRASTSTYSQPITERIPWLKNIELDLQVETPDFRVRSTFPMGQAELDTRFNLRVGGTLGNLQLYNRVEIFPGGQVLYKVIRRDFEIVGGTLDFSGDPSRPRLDIELQTEVTYLPAAASEDQVQDERQVTISIRVSGVPPGVQIEFWSKDSPNFTDADLQSLILTGRPRDESGSIKDRVGLSVDFGRLVNDIIKSPIVEALNITVGAESVTTRMIYRLGRAVRLKTRVVQEATETRVSAGFTFQLSDSLSLEGALQRTDRSANPTQTYEARFKYRIPLE